MSERINWREMKLRRETPFRMPPGVPTTLAGRAEWVEYLLTYVDPETGEACPLISKELAAKLLEDTP